MNERQRITNTLKGEPTDKPPWATRLDIWHASRLRTDTMPPELVGKINVTMVWSDHVAKAEVIQGQDAIRADDVIISAGYRIGPFEVESALVEHPDVVEAAAVAAPDPDRGSIVKAYVVLRSKDGGRSWNKVLPPEA